MIFDFEKMEDFCIKRYKKVCFMKIGMTINKDLLIKLQDLVQKTNLQIVTDCIEGSSDFQINKTNYNVEVKCSTCGKDFYNLMSKTKLKEVLTGKYNIKCPECIR